MAGSAGGDQGHNEAGVGALPVAALGIIGQAAPRLTAEV